MIRALLLLSLGAAGLVGWMYWSATRPPIVREARLGFSSWPEGARPVRIVLLSDIHTGEPETPVSRVEKIVARINGMAPDCVLIAGDFVSDKRVRTRTVPTDEAIAPLARLDPPTLAVLGNHDIWRGAAAVRRSLRGAKIRVLVNEVARCGPLAIGGLDDIRAGRPDMNALRRAWSAEREAVPVLLSHNPDAFLAARDAPLTLAGHSHCGQIAPPLIGALATATKGGRRYSCGLVNESGWTLVVTAGIGTSILPLRWNAPPDMWLLTLGPAVAAR